jgi:hypothetical protein
MHVSRIGRNARRTVSYETRVTYPYPASKKAEPGDGTAGQLEVADDL